MNLRAFPLCFTLSGYHTQLRVPNNDVTYDMAQFDDDVENHAADAGGDDIDANAAYT